MDNYNDRLADFAADILPEIGETTNDLLHEIKMITAGLEQNQGITRVLTSIDRLKSLEAHVRKIDRAVNAYYCDFVAP